jgi:outer membrane protein assembly factor BamB
MPTFDSILKEGDANKDGILSKEESAKTFIKDFFDSNDENKDGMLTREEYDAVLKYMTEGKNTAFAIKAGGAGDITNTHVLWKKTKGLPYIASAIAYGGQLVMVKDNGLVTAYDEKTGKEVYLQERAAASGRYYASPVAANGNIYFTSLDGGAVTVVKAGMDKPALVVKNPKLEEQVQATPAIADDTLYIRTDKHLWAFKDKK